MTERLYYADSFLTNFDATVTEIQELSRANGQSQWRLALDRSAFYPTSGGQPHDTGQLIAVARSGAELIAPVVDVEEDDMGQVWHHTAKPLLPGTRVRGVIDAERRFDHIQQHSGQHVLSASFLRVCNAPTVSFHLGELSSTIDLCVESVSDTALKDVEDLANRIVAEDRSVSVTTVTRQQAEKWLASGELRKLPAREGDLRIIEIAEFDRNACGGTHVRSTGQIGGLHLRSVEKVRQGMRVEFVCGLRAVRSARDDFRAVTEAGRLLAVSSREISEAIEKLQTRGKQAAKEMQAMSEELIGQRAVQLARETSNHDGLRIVRLHFTSADYPSPGDAKLLASKLISAGERIAVIFAWRSAGENSPTTIIFARSSDLHFDCGALLRETLAAHGGRGGGSKDMAQGSISQVGLLPAMDALDAQAKNSKAPL